jgi:ATP-binding cassette, subfamily B, bacterial HlyB/CyaB
LEGRRRREWDRRVADAVNARHGLGLLSNYPETLTLPFQRLIYSGCMTVGAYMILVNVGTPTPSTITPGALVAFALLSMRLGQPLIRVAELQRDLAEVRGSIGQVAQVVNAPPEDTRTNGLRLPIKGEVMFKGVRFRYAPGAPYALDEVTFTVPAGSMLGIMGRSGSGKTTVTRLLQCLNTTYEGMIKIDGMDLREIDLMHLRTHIGVVPQENFLFSGTIRENIAMAKPDASFADVVRAAQLSGAEEFIERLPRGYDTEIQEGGSNLSGGQRQRLALARALIIDPPVLILDEATSALDAESEAIVNANLKRMAKGRTVLSISHRLSMLVESDAILVLEQGKVYDMGTHEELLRRCDIYKHMWYQQNRHLDPRAADMPFSVSRGVA